jgi:AraC-like DNA-binding protein
MQRLVSSAKAFTVTEHPKTQQIIREIERGGTRQQERSLAKRYNVSRWHLSRMIPRQTGRYYSDLIRAAVIRAAIAEVVETNEHFSQIAYARGYQHLSQFDHDFLVTFGCSPRDFRRTARVCAAREDHNSS